MHIGIFFLGNLTTWLIRLRTHKWRKTSPSSINVLNSKECCKHSSNETILMMMKLRQQLILNSKQRKSIQQNKHLKTLTNSWMRLTKPFLKSGQSMREKQPNDQVIEYEHNPSILCNLMRQNGLLKEPHGTMLPVLQ